MHIISYNIFRSQMSAISAFVQSSTTGTFRTSQSLLTTMALLLLSSTVPTEAFDIDKQCLGMYPQVDIENFLGVGVGYADAARSCCGLEDFWSPYAGENFDDFNDRLIGFREKRGDLVDQLNRLELNGTTVFYDSVCGVPLFVTTRKYLDLRQSYNDIIIVFNESEVVSKNVRHIVENGDDRDGYAESLCNTGLGRYHPGKGLYGSIVTSFGSYDIEGGSYHINLSCIAGNRSSIANDLFKPFLHLQNAITVDAIGDGSNYTSTKVVSIVGLPVSRLSSSFVEDEYVGFMAFAGLLFIPICLAIATCLATCLYCCKKPPVKTTVVAKRPTGGLVFDHVATYGLFVMLFTSNIAIWWGFANQQVYYDIQYNLPILISALSVVLIILGAPCVGKKEKEQKDRLFNAIFHQEHRNGQKNISIEVTDRHEDFTKSTIRSVVLGSTQIILLWFYVFAIIGPRLEDAIIAAPKVFAYCGDLGFGTCLFTNFFFSGFVTTFGYLLGTGKFDTPVKTVKFWKTIYDIESRSCAERGTVTYHPDSKLSQRQHIRYVELTMRAFFSTIVNVAGFIGLAILIPLQVSLMREDDLDMIFMDFVFNLIAGFFIIEMDNISTQMNEIVYTPANPAAGALMKAINLAHDATNVINQAAATTAAHTKAVKAALGMVNNAVAGNPPSNPNVEVPIHIAALLAANVALRAIEDLSTFLNTAYASVNYDEVCVAAAKEMPEYNLDLLNYIVLVDTAKSDSKRIMITVVDIVIIAGDAVTTANTNSDIKNGSGEPANAPVVLMEEMQEAITAMKESSAEKNATLLEIATATVDAAKKAVIAAKAIAFLSS